MSEVFERKVAEGLAEFWPRLVNPRSRLWLATTPSQGGQIVGSIAIDGEDHVAGFCMQAMNSGLANQPRSQD